MTVTIPVVSVPVPVSIPVPVISVVPAVVIEHSVAEIPSMLAMEPVAIVFEINTIPVVTAPGRVGVTAVAGEFSFGDAEAGIDIYLGISGVRYQASGDDHRENK